MDTSSAVVSSNAAAAEDSTPADAPAEPVQPVVTNAFAEDEVESPSAAISTTKVVAGNASAKSSARKGKTSPSLAAASSANAVPPMQPPSQLQAPSSTAGSVGGSTSATGSSANDASSDYLSSSSTGSLKHDDAATIALKQSTFQVLKESVSKPKNAGKKDNLKAKAVANPVTQHVSHPADTKSNASVSSAKPPRGHSPPVPAVATEAVVKLDPLQDPLRLVSCAAFLALPSYSTVFEKKALCFDISHAKCYRWLVPRRSLVLIVDRDAHLLRGVFETTGTVIIDPRKDVPSAMSAYVPISPLKELFAPVSLTRVTHLMNFNSLCEESPFELLTSSQVSAILQILSTPAVTPSQPPRNLSIEASDVPSAQRQTSVLKQPSSSSSAVPLDRLSISSASYSSHESSDSRKVQQASSNYRQPIYAPPTAGFHQTPASQREPERFASSARPLYQPFPSASGASVGTTGLPSFPPYDASATPHAPTSSSMFNADASSYAPSGQYGQFSAEMQQTSYSTATWGGYSPWGGFDQRIFGRNESSESPLGGLQHEFQQVRFQNPHANEEVSAAQFFWGSASHNSQYAAAPQSKSRFFGKVDAPPAQSSTLSVSAGMQGSDKQNEGGTRQMPWTPMEHGLSSGFGADDFGSNTYTRSSQQQWQNLSAELLDQRGKAVYKH